MVVACTGSYDPQRKSVMLTENPNILANPTKILCVPEGLPAARSVRAREWSCKRFVNHSGDTVMITRSIKSGSRDDTSIRGKRRAGLHGFAKQPPWLTLMEGGKLLRERDGVSPRALDRFEASDQHQDDLVPSPEKQTILRAGFRTRSRQLLSLPGYDRLRHAGAGEQAPAWLRCRASVHSQG